MNKAYYGRKWLLQVACNDGSVLEIGEDGISEETPLKVTFDVNYPGYQGWYFSEFNIWNLTSDWQQKIIGEGSEIWFYAGYKEGNYGLLFSGKVFQPFLTREGVVNYKLTLMCMDGDRLFKDNFISTNMPAGYTESQLVNAIAAQAFTPIPVNKITERLAPSQLVRKSTIFASPDVPIREVVRNNIDSYLYMREGKLNIVDVNESDSSQEPLGINSKTGLVGTPQQTDFGINFRVLLNPVIGITNPPMEVKVDLSKVNIAMQRAVLGRPVSVVDQTGWFKVGGVRHFGDSRGNEWYTDVTGYALSGKTPANLTVPLYLQRASSN